MASRALVVGVGTYDDDSGIDGYPAIEASARAYGDALARDPRWGEAGSVVLGRDGVRTADGVMRALQEAAADGESGDTLLVVYIGHGKYWQDVPDGQVHFAVGSSRINEPWTWLSTWYVYRAIKKSKADLKVLIADCCDSNKLRNLGPETTLPGALGTRLAKGTCVLTAVGGDVRHASAEPCTNLPAPLNTCTPFSGHLLNVLAQGLPDHRDDLTLGALRAGIDEGMQECGVHHAPRMVLNDASEAAPLFTNPAKGRRPWTRALDTVDEWVRELLLNGDRNLPDLMRRPDLAGHVMLKLKDGNEESRDLARRVDRKASELLLDPADFVRYWGVIEPAMLGGG